VSSLEKEVMRLQEVLKEREAEIATLESSIQQAQVSKNITVAVPVPNGVPPVESLPLVKEEYEQDPTVSIPRTPNGTSPLSADTMDQFVELRQRIGQHQPSEENEEEALTRLDELMRSMAQKESAHREVVDDLTEQLETLRRQLDELTALSRDQTLNMSNQAEKMSAEIGSLQTSLEMVTGQKRDVEAELSALQQREAELVEARRQADEEHELEIKKLQLEHSLELKKLEEEAAEKLAVVHEEHKAMMVRIVETHGAALQGATAETKRAHEIATRDLEGARIETETAVARAVADLQQAHDRNFEDFKTRQLADSRAELSKAHEEALANLRSEHEVHILTKDSETAAFLRQAQQEYKEQIRQKEAHHATALQRLREEHAAELKSVTAAREGLLSDTQAEQTAAIEQLLAEHSASSERKDAVHAADLAKLKVDHEQVIKSVQDAHIEAINKLNADHERAIEAAIAEKTAELERLNAALETSQQEHRTFRDEMESSLALLKTEHEIALRQRDADHQVAIAELTADHHTALSDSHDALARAREQHEKALDELRQQHEQEFQEERNQQLATLEDLEIAHSREKEELVKEHDALEDELANLKDAADQASVEWSETRKSHEATLSAKDEVIAALQTELANVDEERTMFAEEIEHLRKELQRALTEQSKLAQEISTRDSLAQDLERHRTALSEVQTALQQSKAEMVTLQAEKARQDQTLKDLQNQLASSKTSEDGHVAQPLRLDRSIGRNGIPAAKPPPLSPPPSIPPPPIPANVISHQPDASISSITTGRTSSGSREADNDTSTIGTSVTGPSNAEQQRFYAQLEEQARQLDEQDAMIKTLNKQLTHCESDLQAHMDLVATLETSLTDSERNLRKARIQANEYAKERDALNGQIDVLRIQLQEAQHEVVQIRRSIVEEKQNLEHRLDEERRAKERARAQLDSRMEEMQKRKSKFACI
jgi:kinesin family protein 4/21/27